MACEEHIKLSDYLKSIHLELREVSQRIGATAAWQEHLKKHEHLKKYADSMNKLANVYWKNESHQNRIEWVVEYSKLYFIEDESLLQQNRAKEAKISGREIVNKLEFPIKQIQLLDVGSCFNPFKHFNIFIPLAIDIAPATDDVMKCDFLTVRLTAEKILIPKNKTISFLPKNHFDIVVFSLVLEYLPSSEQRIQLCQNAYDVLKPEGLLFIITPDSKHVGANAKLMKTWRYSLSLMGFARIKFEKLENITCMVFRRSIFPEVPRRWGELHKEDYMENEIHISQDFNAILEKLDPENVFNDKRNDSEVLSMFSELPRKLSDVFEDRLAKPANTSICEKVPVNVNNLRQLTHTPAPQKRVMSTLHDVTNAWNQKSNTKCLLTEMSDLTIETIVPVNAKKYEEKSREQILEERKLRKKQAKEQKSLQKYMDDVKNIRSNKSQQIQIIDKEFMDRYQKLTCPSNQNSNSKVELNTQSPALQKNSSSSSTSTKRIKQKMKYKPIMIPLEEFFNLKPHRLDTKPVIINKPKLLVRAKKKRLDNSMRKRPTTLKKNILQIRLQRKSNQNLSEIRPENNEIKINIASKIQHSRKFRQYCDHYITPEICASIESTLNDLFRFQKRAFDKNEVKGRSRKRYVVGFKEVKKNLESNKLKLLIIAPDLEPSPGDGGIDEMVQSLISQAQNISVPYVFAIPRRKIGYVLMKKVPVSCVGILSYEGCDEIVKNVLRMVEEERIKFKNNS